MSKPVYSLSWMMGLLLAPHALTLLGNVAGSHQSFFFVWLVLAAGLHWINLRSINRAASASGGVYPGDSHPILTILLLGSRSLTTVALSTVLLVTAGFAFNETFVYWFPNFAFAFILLGVVLAVNLWGSEAAAGLQIGATTMVLLGLVSLVVVGLWGYPEQRGAFAATNASFQPMGGVAALLLFVGFDLAFGVHRSADTLQVRTIKWGLAATALLMVLWGWVSLLYVPVEKLSGSYIPYLLTARYVQGDTGRAIMGIVVIAGSVAAVNALFKSLAELLSGYTDRRLGESSGKWLRMFQRTALWHVLCASAVGLMMAGGVAGTDAVDHYVRVGLILWMLYYGGINLSVLIANHRSSKSRTWQDRVLPLIGVVAMWLGGLVLILMESNRGVIYNPFIILGIFVVLMAFAAFFHKRAVSYDIK